MADDPVVFDDGGSTRIKRLNNMAMDALLNVDAGGDESSYTSPGGASDYSTVTITFIDSTGVPKKFWNLKPITGEIKIFSGPNHTITLNLVTNAGIKDLKILVKAAAPRVRLDMEAKHTHGSQRYIVSNAPAIDKVVMQNNATGILEEFDAYRHAPPQTSIIYTCIILK